MKDLQEQISSKVEEILREKLEDLLKSHSTSDLQLFTSKEAAALLKVDTQVVRRLCKEGLLKSHKVCGQYRITRKDIDQYLNRR